MEMSSSQITQIIAETINSLFGNLFSSIDNNLYSILDKTTFINSSILQDNFFPNIFGTSSSSGILLIANALLFGFVIYYAITLLLANFSIMQVQKPHSFLLRTCIITILMNSSFFICEQILEINSLISSSILSIGENIFQTSISFSSLVERLNTIVSIEQSSLNIFSVDGIIKSIISIGFFNLIFSYCLRYILVKILVLVCPFAILSLSIQPQSTFFKSWFRCFIGLLFIQILVSFILLLIFSLDFNTFSLFSKFLYVGSIFVLIKANSYIKEFMGGLSTSIQIGIQNFKSISH